MENNSVQKLIFGFFILIIGLVLIVSVADSSSVSTTKATITNETVDISAANNIDGWTISTTVNFTLTNVPEGWETSECPLSAVTINNATDDELTLTTDYILYAPQGIFSLKNTSSTFLTPTNRTLVDYTFCEDGYLNSAWGRSVLNLVGGFFALALLGASLALFYSIARDAGIIGK